MSGDNLRRHSLEPQAFELLHFLQQVGHATRDEACNLLGWTPHHFRKALGYARDHVCPPLGLAIPHPVPDDHFAYRVTGDWISVDGGPAIEAGCAYAIGQIESRLRAVHRDVSVAIGNLTPDSIGGRKARTLDKHLMRVFQSLAEIDASTPAVVRAEAVA